MVGLTVVKGDLLSVTEGVIAHGVNCRGAFGSGVAGAIAKKFPWVRDSYLHKYNTEGWVLGDVQLVKSDGTNQPKKSTMQGILNIPGVVFANCATQDDFGTDKVNLDYSALEKCIDKVLHFCAKAKLPLAIPRIGCGLAGGDWETVQEIIIRLNADRKVPITVYEL